jgi:proteasome activator subunit 2 (PA28 beta)
MSKTTRSSRVSRTGNDGSLLSRLSPAEQDKLLALSPRLEKLSLGPRSGIVSANHEESANVPFSEKQKLLTAQIQAMIQNLELECYKIIFDVFPEKIQTLDDMYKQRKEFNLKKNEYSALLPDFEEPTGDANEVKRKLARIHIPQNKAICDLFTVLQKEILEMSEMINSLSIWVKLNVPRIADGNNFGVEVQGEISEVLEATESSGYEILDSFTTYHNVRGTLIVQVVEHPGIQDFKESLKELDEKTYIKSSLLACELRNDYITLYDMLSKNMDTLVSPRGRDEDEKIARMY